MAGLERPKRLREGLGLFAAGCGDDVVGGAAEAGGAAARSASRRAVRSASLVSARAAVRGITGR